MLNDHLLRAQEAERQVKWTEAALAQVTRAMKIPRAWQYNLDKVAQMHSWTRRKGSSGIVFEVWEEHETLQMEGTIRPQDARFVGHLLTFYAESNPHRLPTPEEVSGA